MNSAMSLRLRLPLWYATVVAVALTLFSLALYVAFERSALADIDRQLSESVSEARALIPIRALATTSGPVSRIITQPPRFVQFGPPTLYMQTLSWDGDIITQSSNLEGTEIPLTASMLEALGEGQPLFETVRVRDAAIRTYTAPVEIPGSPIAVVQLARSLATLEANLETLRNLLLAGSLLTVIASAALGWFLGNAALRPVEDITGVAERIRESEDLDQRIAYDGPQDEVGRLATSFNRMMERLQTSYGRVEAALEAQRRFTADASHELRTPVTSIRVNADTLLKNPDLPEADHRSALSDIAIEAERMSRLIGQLLTLARADAGLHPAMQTVAIARLVEDAAHRLQTLEPDAEVVTRLDINPEATVLGDPELLRQVLVILGENALRHGKPPLEIAVRREGLEYVFAVSDRGDGIPADELPHVFERFYRGRGAQGEGSGLGLAIARWIVDSHQGSIDLISEPHLGTVFSVRLRAP